ncbi:pyridoxamine 5'-phosphate oxidase family protein [Halobacillus shinanisalinarum]|uniref:Pyridoxamine 5'-phosphate oxidase family protein n=1 Tax=Halobacillus shinanisalinarum TaxID=2932258 RepID=A0ABY4GUY5_9BACI|nr:pyridoxamine 5'-phosphate oxidase family protein [Halobacillus shinanisalinarum]UOQ91771.1 pyridoxamine 5'-phosphate oxidase family protein [Halobacillus shinanisalinarum]
MKPYHSPVRTVEELHSLQGTPGKIADNKVIKYIDALSKQFLAHSPFAIVSTSNTKGECDSSPRGDAPGFTYVLDDKHLLLPERLGNKRADSMRNILENPHIGLLFLIPGIEETLRINGEATIIKDGDLLRKLEAQGHVPKVGIVVHVNECFIHCAKAFKRSKLWRSEEWIDTTSLPSPAKMMADHAKLDVHDEERVQASLNESYHARLY